MLRNQRLTALYTPIRKVTPEVIETVLEVQSENKTGAEKLELASEKIAGTFDIPLVPEYVEVLMIRTAISAIVELAKAIWGDAGWAIGLKEALAGKPAPVGV